MSIQELKAQAESYRMKARGLKTKAAQKKAYDKARELESQVFIELCNQRDQYGKFSFKAIVKHFNPGNEQYMVDTPYGSMWLSPTQDVLSKSWYSGTCCIEYVEGQTIVVDAEIDINHDRLYLYIVPGKVVGGSVNQAQYAELCKQTNLAFFKYPTGMSGFFAKGCL